MKIITYEEKAKTLNYVKQATAQVFGKASCNKHTEFIPDPDKYEWFMKSLCAIRNCIHCSFNSKEASEAERTLNRMINTYRGLERAVNCQGTTVGFYADDISGNLYFEYIKLCNSLNNLQRRIVSGSPWNLFIQKT